MIQRALQKNVGKRTSFCDFKVIDIAIFFRIMYQVVIFLCVATLNETILQGFVIVYEEHKGFHSFLYYMVSERIKVRKTIILSYLWSSSVALPSKTLRAICENLRTKGCFRNSRGFLDTRIQIFFSSLFYTQNLSSCLVISTLYIFKVCINIINVFFFSKPLMIVCHWFNPSVLRSIFFTGFPHLIRLSHININAYYLSSLHPHTFVHLSDMLVKYQLWHESLFILQVGS